jgi:hypothetical protein
MGHSRLPSNWMPVLAVVAAFGFAPFYIPLWLVLGALGIVVAIIAAAFSFLDWRNRSNA